VIGWGAEGTIRVVKRQRDSQFFVAKVFKSAPNRVHFIRGSFEYTIGHITRGHPNLVSVVDLTRANDLCFTTMEYVPGGNLRMALAKPGYLRSQTLVDGIFVQLCRAILWMHAMGVSHRDIKLENIMWHPRRPLVKLTDFGNCDIFWAAKGFVDDTFESLSTLGSAAFDKASVKQDRHLTDLILRGVGMTGAMSAGQIVTSLGGDLSYLAEKKPNGVAVKGSATPTAAKGKLFTTNDSDTDESDFDDDKADGGSTRSSVDRNDNIPKPYLDDATSPTTYPVDGTDEEKANEGAFKGFLPISPSEFRKPSRYWNPATKTSSPSPPTFAPTDQPTSRQSPIRLSFGVVGTTAYMAPEQFASAGRRPSPEEAVGWYDPRKVDVWMIAVAYIYTSTRRIPWGSATESEVAYRRWREGKGNKIIDDWREQRLPAFDSREDQKRYHKQSSSGFQVAASERADLVRRMLECDPGKRPTMEEVVWDPVFVKLSDEFERKAKGLAERGFYVDLNDAPKGGASFSGL
jgi:serine/threonine protein kinase